MIEISRTKMHTNLRRTIVLRYFVGIFGRENYGFFSARLGMTNNVKKD